MNRTHGLVSTYNNGCHCSQCREAARLDALASKPPPGGTSCGVCGVRLAEHPIRTCWREAMGGRLTLDAKRETT